MATTFFNNWEIYLWQIHVRLMTRHSKRGCEVAGWRWNQADWKWHDLLKAYMDFFWNFHSTSLLTHLSQMKHFYLQQCEHWSKYFFPGATVQHFSPYHKSENSDRSVILDAGPILVALVTNIMQVSGPGWHHHQVGNDTKHRATMVSPPTQPSTIFINGSSIWFSSINGSSIWLSSIRSICTLSRF